MKKRMFSMLLIVIFCSSMLVLANGIVTAAETGLAKKITVALIENTSDYKTMKPRLEEWGEANGVEVEVIGYPSKDYLPTLLTAWAGGSDKFDLFQATTWVRDPGTTEDGIERQKLIATAIIEKKDRILAHDLVAVWVRDLDPEKIVFKQEPFDGLLLKLARAGVPPVELGRLWPFPNVVSMGRASHPIGLINAGDPRGAADDTFEVGKVYAGGLAGAFSGISVLPKDWSDQVNEATKNDPYSNNHRTIDETVDGLYDAFIAKQSRLKEYVTMMEE